MKREPSSRVEPLLNNPPGSDYVLVPRDAVKRLRAYILDESNAPDPWDLIEAGKLIRILEESLTAAPAPAGKAVAWRYRFSPDLQWHVVEYENDLPRRASFPTLEIENLYASPPGNEAFCEGQSSDPNPTQPDTKPLTDGGLLPFDAAIFELEVAAASYQASARPSDDKKLYDAVKAARAKLRDLFTRSTPPMEPVAWRAVGDFEGKYEVSSAGDIRSIRTGKVLSKGALAGDGYVKAEFWKDNERTQTYVHRVVARAFLGEPPAGTEINHKDGNKLNNAVSNLEWVTKSENVRHAMYELGARVKPVIATDEKTGAVTRYPSIEEAARDGHIANHIRECIRGECRQHHSKRWEFADSVPTLEGDYVLVPRETLKLVRDFIDPDTDPGPRQAREVLKIVEAAMIAASPNPPMGGE